MVAPDAVDRTAVCGGERPELKAIRDSNTGVALGAFGRWAAVPGGIPN